MLEIILINTCKKTFILNHYLPSWESCPYPSDNAKRQFDVMFFTLPPTYDNVKRGNKCIPWQNWTKILTRVEVFIYCSPTRSLYLFVCVYRRKAIISTQLFYDTSYSPYCFHKISTQCFTFVRLTCEIFILNFLIIKVR